MSFVLNGIVVAISVTIGSLLLLALANFFIFSIVEMDLPKGSANIGLGLLLLAILISIPVALFWIVRLSVRRPPGRADGEGRRH